MAVIDSGRVRGGQVPDGERGNDLPPILRPVDGFQVDVIGLRLVEICRKPPGPPFPSAFGRREEFPAEVVGEGAQEDVREGRGVFFCGREDFEGHFGGYLRRCCVCLARDEAAVVVVSRLLANRSVCCVYSGVDMY